MNCLKPSIVEGDAEWLPSCHALFACAVAGLEQEIIVLYCELISHRGSWAVNAAGCRALAECSIAATTMLLSREARQALQR